MCNVQCTITNVFPGAMNPAQKNRTCEHRATTQITVRHDKDSPQRQQLRIPLLPKFKYYAESRAYHIHSGGFKCCTRQLRVVFTKSRFSQQQFDDRFPRPALHSHLPRTGHGRRL